MAKYNHVFKPRPKKYADLFPKFANLVQTIDKLFKSRLFNPVI